MKRRVLGLVAAVLLAAGASPAEATVVNYAFSGAGSGTMALDYDGSFYELDTLSLTLGTATFNESNSGLFPYVGTYYAFGGNLNGVGSVASNTDDFLFLFDPSLTSQTGAFFNAYNAGNQDRLPGSLSITQAAAVPEPASWAMMLLGFGAIGFAMRRSRRRPNALASSFD